MKLMRTKARVLLLDIVVYEISRVRSESVAIPNVETKGASGESTCEKATLVQEKPPNGNLDFRDSVARVIKMKTGTLLVKRAAIPSGRK